MVGSRFGSVECSLYTVAIGFERRDTIFENVVHLCDAVLHEPVEPAQARDWAAAILPKWLGNAIVRPGCHHLFVNLPSDGRSPSDGRVTANSPALNRATRETYAKTVYRDDLAKYGTHR